ncbi:methyltransferase [Actinoallomurus iriomotensis]|uniref:Methyltransferase n=1 Tax=Actinoallomurus iriomotensis TaxID=478107 RepID=A0A9W6S0T6_9ACTN|nr:methyltransferase [Actinoallomurus iriomotensis]GLY75497.1 methyltransferase [Actinoallomurus iriomotensis]GLY85108.1 methyltransferase [Actinoallomurus iriomotensis]
MITTPLPVFSDGRSPQDQVLMMLTGKWVSQILHVLARLGVADLLADGPRTPADLAAATDTDERSLYRFLRAAASLGVFAERPDGGFELTPTAEYLRSDVPGTMRYMAMFWGEAASWGCYRHVMDTVRTGEPIADKELGGRSWFEYLEQNPGTAETFHRAMTSVNWRAAEIADRFDFGAFGRIADIGGGQGRLLASILRKNPGVQGILFDLPTAIDGAQPVLKEEGVADRVECVRGDFFGPVPEADAYLLRAILHDWDDEKSVLILRRIREAIGTNADARVLIIEAVLPPLNEWHYSKLMDVDMMVCLGGGERTRDEWGRLLATAGFELAGVTDGVPPHSIVEARPV